MRESAGNAAISENIAAISNNLGGMSFSGKRAVVTGGAGFLGSWICETLLTMGADVICLDNLSSGSESNIEHLLSSAAFKFIKADVADPYSIDGQVDFIFHMASRAGPFEFEKYPLEILKANTMGIVNSLEIARQKKSRLIFTSTSETYGNPSVVPTPETYYGNVNSIGVRGCYDEAKRCGEAYSMAYIRQYSVDVRIARIFNTYGPRMRGDGIYGRAIPRFLDQAMNGNDLTVFGDGKQTRSFCFVSDQIEGLLRLAMKDNPAHRVINIGTNDEITIIELVHIIKELIPTESRITFNPLPQDDPLKRCPDTTRAKEILGWTPKVSLKQGLKATINWTELRQNPVALGQKGTSPKP